MTRKTRVVDENRAVGEVLRQLRDERGLRQIDVAYPVGLSEDSYSRYERGETGLRMDQIPSFAAAFTMTSEALRARLGMGTLYRAGEDERGRRAAEPLVGTIEPLDLRDEDLPTFYSHAGRLSIAEKDLDQILSGREPRYQINVRGDCLEEHGVSEGDVLIVDRGLRPKRHGAIVVVRIGDETLLRVWQKTAGWGHVDFDRDEYREIDVHGADLLGTVVEVRKRAPGV